MIIQHTATAISNTTGERQQIGVGYETAEGLRDSLAKYRWVNAESIEVTTEEFPNEWHHQLLWDQQYDLVKTYKSFDCVDQRSRPVGANITTYRVDSQAPAGENWGGHRLGWAPGQVFVAIVQNTRVMRDFGASQPPNFFETAEERDAWVEKTLASRKKSAQKKFAVHPLLQTRS